MTETDPDRETADPPEPDALPPEAPDDDVADDAPGDIAAVRREAAAHRVKLRETEAQRDALAKRLEALQRREAERLASTPADDFLGLRDGTDLWREGLELGELVDEDGTLDAQRVRAAVQALADAGHAHWLRSAARPAGDSDAGKGRPSMPAAPSFGQAVKGARR